MTTPNLRLTSVSLAAPDPRALAAFYARLLGLDVTASEPARSGHPPQDGWAQIKPSNGVTLNFENRKQAYG